MEKGKKGFFARGVVTVSSCFETNDEIPDTGFPMDPNCSSVFYKDRFITNHRLSKEYSSCFVDFATQNESNHPMLLEKEQKLLN
jgi:hypothetical protein